jgi:hypothetical protein
MLTTDKSGSNGGTLRAQCCDDADCAAGTRNRFYVGKRLTPDALRIEQRFLNERRHLINRAMHGHGVVYGFAVDAMPPAKYEVDREHEMTTGRLRIGPGVAIDEVGRELVLTGNLDLPFGSLILLDVDGKRTNRLHRLKGNCWKLRAHYAEQDRDPVSVGDGCGCNSTQWDRVCETVRFSLQPVDCEDCCADPGDELKCRCVVGPCCKDDGPTYGADTCAPPRRGGCQCVCEHLTGLQPGTDCAPLCEIEDSCGRVRVDLQHGVALACVGVKGDDCNTMFDGDVDACGPRRLVKRNDLLFDLIRGTDLTRICDVGWAPWHRKTAPWGDFVESFGKEDPGSGQNPTERYWIEFSRPVQADSLSPDCFAMTVIVPEAEGGWRQTLRVPIVDVRATVDEGVPAGLATRALLVVDSAWVNDALVSARTRFGAGAEVEIEVRGDYITDCNGQQVDANARGPNVAPSGNGSPGGSLLSTFRVEPKPPRAAYAQGVRP